MENNVSFYIVSLGCPKNLVDSEEVAGLLIDRGYVSAEQPSDADVLVVNTCAFIKEAVEETIDTILELENFKTRGQSRRLAVIGCFVQRYGKKLLPLFPEVDIFLGTGFFLHFPDALKESLRSGKKIFRINRPVAVTDKKTPRASSGPFFTSYVKISEGCSNSCTFCLIPRLRGPQRSRPLELVVSEARDMVDRGAKEIVLVGQDTTAYGTDLGAPGLITLLEELARIPGLRWIRMMYSHPSGISNELLHVVKEHPVILPYFDIPVQHAVPRILEAMGRECKEHPENLVERIRKIIPDAVLRTSLIVGFPGETTRDFKRLLRFVERVQFDRLGVFGFSPEAGTKAYLMKPRVRNSTISKRRDELLTLQAEISMRKHGKLLGSVQEVMVEETPCGGRPGKGRLWSQAPEVDGNFLFTDADLQPGDIAYFRITAAHPYDLEGIPANHNKNSTRNADSF